MGKKKKFIEKKEAQHFALVYRSQKDPEAANPDASDRVLMPVAAPNLKRNRVHAATTAAEREGIGAGFDSDDEDAVAAAMLAEMGVDAPLAASGAHTGGKGKGKGKKVYFEGYKPRSGADGGGARGEQWWVEDITSKGAREDDWELGEYGLPNDGYDYSQHFKEMGGGTVVTYRKGELPESSLYLPPEVLPSAEESSVGMLHSGVMDGEWGGIDGELFGDFDEVDELADDFVQLLNSEEPVARGEEVEGKEAAAAEGTAARGAADGAADGAGSDAVDRAVAEAAAAAAAARGEAAGRYNVPGSWRRVQKRMENAPSHEEEAAQRITRVVEEQFDLVAAEYDDEEIGELEYGAVEGDMDISAFADVLDEYIESTNLPTFKDTINEGMAADAEEGGDEALAQREMVQGMTVEALQRHCEAAGTVPSRREREAELEALAETEDTVVWVEHDTTPKEQWDVETFVSTYTNTDNHPGVIREPRKSRKKQIVLSKKTGIPLNVLPNTKQRKAKPDAGTVVDTSRPRDRNEDKAAKRARKQALKEEKRRKREEKKNLKLAYKEESMRQAVGAQSGGGVHKGTSIVKY